MGRTPRAMRIKRRHNVPTKDKANTSSCYTICMKYVPAWTLFTHLRALTSLHARRDMTAAVLENNLIRDLTAQTLASAESCTLCKDNLLFIDRIDAWIVKLVSMPWNLKMLKA